MKQMKWIGLLLLILLFAVACSKKEAAETKNQPAKAQAETMNDTQDSVAILETSDGRVVIDLFEDQTPLHAANFKKLMHSGVLKGTYFHRIIPNFVVQGGDPNTKNDARNDDGMGGVGDRIPAEIGQKHLRGCVGAARDNNPAKASNGSQFYICLTNLPQLDGNYTVFGKVVEGMNNVDLMAQAATDANDNPLEHIYINDTSVMSKADYANMKAEAAKGNGK